jgi:hypothetical protein
MTPIPPANEAADAIQSVGESIARDVEAYGEAARNPLPDGVTHEKLAAEAKTKIDQQRQRLDELVADGLDLISGKTESPHTTRFFLRPCVMDK